MSQCDARLYARKLRAARKRQLLLPDGHAKIIREYERCGWVLFNDCVVPSFVHI